MHPILKHITNKFGIVLLSFFISIGTQINAEQSVENIIKSRKALLSKNYSTAKRVQSYSSNGDFDKAKELMSEMSKNYNTLLKLFPENTQEGFKTEALPIIWEEKEAFDKLMKKASSDMIKLSSLIEGTDDISGSLKQLMWNNCKACHSKYRKPH